MNHYVKQSLAIAAGISVASAIKAAFVGMAGAYAARKLKKEMRKQIEAAVENGGADVQRDQK